MKNIKLKVTNLPTTHANHFPKLQQERWTSDHGQINSNGEGSDAQNVRNGIVPDHYTTELH